VEFAAQMNFLKKIRQQNITPYVVTSQGTSPSSSRPIPSLFEALAVSNVDALALLTDYFGAFYESIFMGLVGFCTLLLEMPLLVLVPCITQASGGIIVGQVREKEILFTVQLI
jgi:hypothetical protein